MKFLVEIDHCMPSQPLPEDAARAFIENIIFPTLTRAEQLVNEGRISSGGPVAGRIALRFIADVETPRHLDQMISSIPLWAVADTRVTPLIEFTERRAHIQGLLQHIRKS